MILPITAGSLEIEMRTEAEAREEMIQTLRYMWERGHANTTGVSISERLEDRPGHILVDQSGTGFRKCDVTINDLLIIDEDCALVEDAPNGARRKAPVNVVIHTEYYKANPLARTCVHCHAPFTQVFACKNRAIPPFTLQAKLIGEVPCVFLDDRKLKKEYVGGGETIAVPSGLHARDEVFYVMKKVAEETVRLLSPRNAEMKNMVWESIISNTAYLCLVGIWEKRLITLSVQKQMPERCYSPHSCHESLNSTAG